MNTHAPTPARLRLPWMVRLGLVLGCLMVGLAVAGPASAHTRLESVSPADGSTVTTAPTSVTLTFDEAVQSGLSQIRVTGLGDDVVSTGAVHESGAKVSIDLVGSLAAGKYTVVWKVVSDDGHPVSGTSRFTYSPAQAKETTPAQGTPSVSESTPATSTSESTPPGTAPTSGSGATSGQVSTVTGDSSTTAAAAENSTTTTEPVASTGTTVEGGLVLLILAGVIVILLTFLRQRRRSHRDLDDQDGAR